MLISIGRGMTEKAELLSGSFYMIACKRKRTVFNLSESGSLLSPVLKYLCSKEEIPVC
jgi:hypothetical protein